METLTSKNIQSQIDNENVFIQSSRNFLGIEIQLIENHPGENHWIYDKTNNTLDTVELVIDVYELLEKKLNKRLKKQPLVAKLINTVIEYDMGVEAELFSIGESFDEYGKKIEPLVNKFENKEIRSHLKNVGFNMKTISDNLLAKMDVLGFPENNNMASEQIDDKINAIVVSQKAKRLIKKVYSEKHRDLVNQDTIDKFKIIVEKDIDIKKIRSLYSNKMASFKDVNDANQRLDKFINTISGWTKELYLEKSKKLNVEVISSKDDILCLKIKDYHQSKEMGSGQWCLSYDEYYFNSYKKIGKSLFFIYDFSKEQSDRESMYGIIPDIGDENFIGHWRDDSAITNAINISENWPNESLEDLANNAYLDIERHTKRNDVTFADINNLDITHKEYIKILDFSIKVEALHKSSFQYVGDIINYILESGSNEDKINTKKVLQKLLDIWDIKKIDTDIIKTVCLSDDEEDILKHFNNIVDNHHLSYTIPSLLGNESIDRQDLALSVFRKQKEKDPMNQIFHPTELATQLVKLSSTSVNDLSNFMKECILINGGHCEIDPILYELAKNSEKNYIGNLDLLEIVCNNSNKEQLKLNWEYAKSKYIDELKEMPKLFGDIDKMMNTSTKKKEIKKGIQLR